MAVGVVQAKSLWNGRKLKELFMSLKDNTTTIKLFGLPFQSHFFEHVIADLDSTMSLPLKNNDLSGKTQIANYNQPIF